LCDVGKQNLFPELYGGVRASVVEIPEKLDSFQSLQEVLRRIKVKGNFLLFLGKKN
jgi:hypothetical protein